MRYVDRYVGLLAALGLAARLDLAQAARAGACTLRFHDAFELTISAAPDAQRVRLHAPLGIVGVTDERERARVLGALLQIPMARVMRHRVHLGFDPLHDRILLCRTVDLVVDDDVARAVPAVESFLRQGIALLHALPSLLHPAPCAATRRPASPPTSAFV